MCGLNEIQKCYKKCTFFVVPGNGQVLLGMPDTVVLNLINLHINSIQALTAECKTNRKQETHTSIMACTNTSTTRGDDTKNNSVSRDIKQHTNGHSQPGNKHISINYFHWLNNIDSDKKNSIAMMQKIHTWFGNIYNDIGCIMLYFIILISLQCFLLYFYFICYLTPLLFSPYNSHFYLI